MNEQRCFLQPYMNCSGGCSCSIAAVWVRRLIQASKHRGDVMHELLLHELKFNGTFEHGSNSCVWMKYSCIHSGDLQNDRGIW